MKRKIVAVAIFLAVALPVFGRKVEDKRFLHRGTITAPQASARKPNIVFITGDDIGWYNIGAYHQGIMAGRTPNLDRLAARAPGPTTS
jgi:hypothetical protein